MAHASGVMSLICQLVIKGKMVVVTIDHVENAINELLGQDRFIEP